MDVISTAWESSETMEMANFTAEDKRVGYFQNGVNV